MFFAKVSHISRLQRSFVTNRGAEAPRGEGLPQLPALTQDHLLQLHT